PRRTSPSPSGTGLTEKSPERSSTAFASTKCPTSSPTITESHESLLRTPLPTQRLAPAALRLAIGRGEPPNLRQVQPSLRPRAQLLCRSGCGRPSQSHHGNGLRSGSAGRLRAPRNHRSVRSDESRHV